MKRKDIIRRNNPVIRNREIHSPLSLGNGDFAYAADITGFQTFSSEYKAPLCIQSNWGWHSFPGDHYSKERQAAFNLTYYIVNGRIVGYPVSAQGQEMLFEQLRRNPHRLNLGRILLKGCDEEFTAADFADFYQELDLWSGLLTSSYLLKGRKIMVCSACHPELDALSFTVKCSEPPAGLLVLEMEFPYADTSLPASGELEHPGNRTHLVNSAPGMCDLLRCLDDANYFLRICYKGLQICFSANNRLCLVPIEAADTFELAVHFAPANGMLTELTVQTTEEASRQWWEHYWSAGGITDFSGCTDPRACELERRVVLSQYLTAIQCAGSLPPQETGLSGNSWYGKFHLEMHYWHAAHFPLWKRPQLLEKSMWWYYSILNMARQTAQNQGYRGARWPKMTGPAGWESPSTIGPYLIWQQPHPIHYAELLYRAAPSPAVLERYRELVYETAEFMVSYVSFNQNRDCYILQPPLIPAQENHNPCDVLNPAFELEYWHFGLTLACQWYRRLNLTVPERWCRVAEKMAQLPVRDSRYLAHANCPDTYTRFNRDHPSFLGAMGVLPGTRIDKTIMQNSVKQVFASWNFPETWGWDFPMIAMTAARTGLPELAVDALLLDTPKNSYLPNGHNSQFPGESLSCYLPGNGGLLLAIGLMAAGWENGPDRKTPGFPDNGLWDVNFTDILPAI